METMSLKHWLIQVKARPLVRRECLDVPNTCVQGKLRVRCIHGDEREYPKTDLVIEIEGQAYHLSVGVLEQSPYPVILGRDVPVLVDLLQNDKDIADARVVTRAQAKQDMVSKQSFEDLPFDVSSKPRNQDVRGVRKGWKELK